MARRQAFAQSRQPAIAMQRGRLLARLGKSHEAAGDPSQGPSASQSAWAGPTVDLPAKAGHAKKAVSWGELDEKETPVRKGAPGFQ